MNIELFSKLGVPEAVVMLGLGVAVLLFGYRIKKIAFFIAWFLLGFSLMQLLMPTINIYFPMVAASELYQILLPIAGGLLLALLGFSIEKFCISALSFVLVMIVTIQYFGTDWVTLAIGGVIGVIAAVAAVRLMKPAVIIATSIIGAYAITMSLAYIIPDIDFSVYYWLMMIVVSTIGAIFQFATTKHIE